MKKLSKKQIAQVKGGYDHCVSYQLYVVQTQNDPGAMFADLIFWQGKAYMCW